MLTVTIGDLIALSALWGGAGALCALGGVFIWRSTQHDKKG